MKGHALRSNLWADLTRDEIAAARDAGALVVIPVGATEQHAGHLPTGTDTCTASSVALAAARACGHPVLVAPAVPVAFSPHHGAWPGTLTLRLSTLQSLLDDITGCIARAGFTRQLLVNGHGGNRGPLMAITAEFITAGRGVGLVDYFAPAMAQANAMLAGAGRGVTHAGEVETALMLHLADPDTRALITGRAASLPPRLKATHKATGASANPIARAGAWWPPVYGAQDVGYNGDPAAATVQTGAALMALYVETLAQFYTDFALADLATGGMPPRGPSP